MDNHAHGAASVAPEQVKEVLQDHLINNPGERFNGTPLKEICQGAGITSHESVTSEIFGFSAVSKKVI